MWGCAEDDSSIRYGNQSPTTVDPEVPIEPVLPPAQHVTDDSEAVDPPFQDQVCREGGAFQTAGMAAPIILRRDGSSIADLEANIGSDGFQPFKVWTCGDDAASVVVNLFQVLTSTSWDEEHELPNVASTTSSPAAAPSATFHLTMDHVDYLSYVNNESSIFNDADDPTGHGDGTLTYAVRLYDGAGSLLDCIVFGQDTDGVFAPFVSNNDGPTAADLSDLTTALCDVLTLPR